MLASFGDEYHERNLKDLLAQKAAIEKQIEEAGAPRTRRRDCQGEIPDGRTWPEHCRPGARGATKAARKAAAKVAAKYRNAATGDSWSGRGLRPNWLKAALASGKKLEDFAV